jgi:hypothetical protein
MSPTFKKSIQTFASWLLIICGVAALLDYFNVFEGPDAAVQTSKRPAASSEFLVPPELFGVKLTTTNEFVAVTIPPGKCLTYHVAKPYDLFRDLEIQDRIPGYGETWVAHTTPSQLVVGVATRFRSKIPNTQVPVFYRFGDFSDRKNCRL